MSTNFKRFKTVVSMNMIIKYMNNEDAYMEWIYTVPDGAEIEDFEDIANDEEFFGEVVDEFFRICKAYGKDGLYIK